MTDVEKRRTKIKVISVGEPKSFEGGGTVLHFKAQEEGVTNVLTFETWVTQLFDTIKGAAGQVIEVDVKEVPSKNGEYINNRVGQVYVNGEPVNKRGGGGYRGDSDSPEKRASIEAQTAAHIIKDLLIAGKLEEKDALVLTLRKWLGVKIDQKAPPAPGPKADVKKAEKDSDELWQGIPSASTSAGNGARSFENLGQFLTACLKELGLDRTAVLANLAITKTSEIADYGKAWDALKEYTKGV